MSSRRPALVTWLSLGVLTLGGVYLIRLIGGLNLPALPLSVPLWYPALTGGVWGFAWVVAAYAFYTGRRWAPRFGWIVGAVFLLWYLADRLLLARSEYAIRTLPVSLGVAALGAILFAWILRQPAVRRYFGETPA